MGARLDEGEVAGDEDVGRLDVAVQQAHLVVQVDEGEGDAGGDGEHVGCGEEGPRRATQLEMAVLEEAVQGALARLEDEAEPPVGEALRRAEADDVRVLDPAEHARLELECPLDTPPLPRLGTQARGRGPRELGCQPGSASQGVGAPIFPRPTS